MSKVLVIDDKRNSREPIVRLLQQAGYEAHWACDAHEAMALTRKIEPDLMILDIMIPPMDGLTFLFLIREDPRSRDTPVVIVSGLSDAPTQQRAHELGVKDYLVKGSFTPEQLLGTVEKHVRQPATQPPPRTPAA